MKVKAKSIRDVRKQLHRISIAHHERRLIDRHIDDRITLAKHISWSYEVIMRKMLGRLLKRPISSESGRYILEPEDYDHKLYHYNKIENERG